MGYNSEKACSVPPSERILAFGQAYPSARPAGYCLKNMCERMFGPLTYRQQDRCRFPRRANDRPPDPLEGLKAMAGSLDADWEQGTPRVSFWPSCLWLSL